MPATSPTSCVSTPRTTSAMVRPSSVAACRSGASILAAVAYQNSPSGVVPSALAASHRSAATRQDRCHSPQPVSGDHMLDRAPVQPVGSMHHTRPRRARAPSVRRRRSLLTLAATTGPRQPRMAGTARLVVFPLCVGPTTTRDWARSAATPAGRTTPGTTPRRSRPEGGASALTRSGRRSRRFAQWAPRGARRRPGLVHCGAPPRYDAPASSAPARATGNAAAATSTTAYRPVMAASVSTMRRSSALRRCCTKNERWPTFHKAMPRRSCGRRSASVCDSDSSSVAASSSPGDCA